MFGTALPRSFVVRYGIAALSVGAAAVCESVFYAFFQPIPFALFFAAVAVGAWFGGIGGGLTATLLSALTTMYLFFPPVHDFRVHSRTDLLRLLLLVLVSLIICTLSALLQQALAQAVATRADAEQARQAALLASERAAFLDEVSTVLTSSLDYSTTLARVAQLGVPRIADWCTVEMRTDDGGIAQLAIVHVDPEKVQWARELNRLNPPDPDAPLGTPHVLRTGQPEFYPEITDAMLVATARSEEELALTRKVGFTAAMVVPMQVHDTVIGALTFISAESGRHYTEEDLRMAGEVARRAALAVENARLFTQAERAIALRDDFISLASHELKTPITSLKMYAQVLQRQAAKQGASQFAERLTQMERQVDRLTGLINDLLDVSKVQHGKLDYQDEPFDLTAVVRERVEEVQATARQHTITITGAIDRPVMGDRERIGQVLTNLLTNAVKYSPEANRVCVRLTAEPDAAVVRVQDFGIGIAPEQQARVFDRFYRVNDSHEKTFPGLGLGLHLAQAIMERHGGALTVESESGMGATFTMTLPFVRETHATGNVGTHTAMRGIE